MAADNNTVTAQSNRLASAAYLLIPLLLVPITFLGALNFGHQIADIIIGIVFFICIINKDTTTKEKKMMIILAVFALIFEEVNVLSGAYKYVNINIVPLWVGLGWAVLGLYIHKNSKVLSKVNNKTTYFCALVIYLLIWLAYGARMDHLIALGFALGSIYVLSKIDNTATHHLFAGIVGMIIEFSGTGVGLWTYFDNLGKPIVVPLLYLSMVYASIVAFCSWLSDK